MKEQARFFETACELGTNDYPAAFDALFGKPVPPIFPEPPKVDGEPEGQ